MQESKAVPGMRNGISELVPMQPTGVVIVMGQEQNLCLESYNTRDMAVRGGHLTLGSRERIIDI